MAVVEDSDSGEYKLGTNTLTIADCKRVVEFEFFLGTARHRRQGMAKLDLLISVLVAFRKALRKEIRLIENKP